MRRTAWAPGKRVFVAGDSLGGVHILSLSVHETTNEGSGAQVRRCDHGLPRERPANRGLSRAISRELDHLRKNSAFELQE
jgi:hypothetical protein